MAAASQSQDSGEGKFSQWAELQPVHLAVLFVWIESQSEVKSFTDQWTVGNVFIGQSGIWEDQDWKTVNKEVKRKGLWLDISKETECENICKIHEGSTKGIHPRGNG